MLSESSPGEEAVSLMHFMLIYLRKARKKSGNMSDPRPKKRQGVLFYPDFKTEKLWALAAIPRIDLYVVDVTAIIFFQFSSVESIADYTILPVKFLTCRGSEMNRIYFRIPEQRLVTNLFSINKPI